MGVDHINGMVAYAVGENETARYNVGGVAGLNAFGDFDSSQFVVRMESGRDYPMSGGLTLTPSVMANYVHFQADSYRETGAGGAGLSVSTDDMDIFELGFGGKAEWALPQPDGAMFNPNLHAGFRYDLVGDEVQATSTFNGGGGAFSTQGADPAQASFNIGAGGKYYATNNWEFTANYDYDLKADFDAHSGYLRAAYKF